MNKSKSTEIILQYYERFHDPKYLTWDPLSVVHRYKGHADLELISLISALFAFGGVKQIMASVEKVIVCMRGDHESISALLLDSNDEIELAKHLLEKLHGFRHRIYIDRDLVLLLLLYRRSLLAYGSLGAHFKRFHSLEAETIELGLSELIRDLKKSQKEIKFKPGSHFKHMLNSPEQKSTCKRWVMYLKWMIRADDGIDLGLWSRVGVARPDQLVIPLDTHLTSISKRLRLTQKKTANWATALEVTRKLKKIDPMDPTKFDFSLCRWGMFEYRKMLEDK